MVVNKDNQKLEKEIKFNVKGNNVADGLGMVAYIEDK